MLFRVRTCTYFREYTFSPIARNALRKIFYFCGSGRSNLCSCTRQCECDNVLDGFWGPGDGCRSDTGSETVPGLIFATFNFHGLGFIREFGENLYTAKISTYTVVTCSLVSLIP